MKNLNTKTKESTPVGGMTYEEIGHLMGITKQGVRRIEKRAIRKLKKRILKDYGYNIANIKEYLLYDPSNQY